jgi:ArsR family transcriptional regulator, lead/cadmium/zinc/bismuth-responsive transcriptional repressor
MRTSLSSPAAVRHGPCATPVGCIRHSTHGVHPPRPPVRFPVQAQIETAAEMFRALGDPEPLRLLVRLAAREACVSELAEGEGEKITTLSARLKTLFSVRLVKRCHEANHVFDALADEHCCR